MDKLKQSDVIQFQEELAKTYFSTTPPAREGHFTQTKPFVKTKNTNRLLYSIISGLVGIFIVSMFLFNRIEVDVKIAPLGTSGVKAEDRSDEKIYLNKDGELNRDVVKHVMFYEGADIDSGWKNDIAVLGNEASTKKAVFGIDFVNTIDMNENLFCFYVKGKAGGEDLKILLRDSNNNICYSKVNTLQNSWKQFVIDLDQAADFLDPQSITHIDFEINPNMSQDLKISKVYFKDMYLIKRRR